VAHVPHTIVTPFNPMLDSNDIFTNPVYAKGYDKRSASQSQNYTQVSKIYCWIMLWVILFMLHVYLITCMINY